MSFTPRNFSTVRERIKLNQTLDPLTFVESFAASIAFFVLLPFAVLTNQVHEYHEHYVDQLYWTRLILTLDRRREENRVHDRRSRTPPGDLG